MTFDEILTGVVEILQRQMRVSSRALKRRFALDEEYREDLKAEILQGQRLASGEDGAVLVWVGGWGRNRSIGASETLSQHPE